MAKFKIGDRVKCVRMVCGNEHVTGKIGTIVENDNCSFGVEFDDFVHGHGCVANGMIHKLGYCWWRKESDLIKACDESTSKSNQKIVITNDGKTTTAKLYDGKKFVKAAKAMCSPEDEFDFERGALIAFSRLVDCDYRLADDTDSFDWNAFKNDKVFVQVTKDNFDEFIEEAEKHDCFFDNHDKFNPFDDIRAFTCLLLFKMRGKDTAAPDGTLFVGYQDEKLKVTSINIDNRPVIVW